MSQTQTQTQTSASGTFAGLAVSRYGATPAQRFDGAARGSVAKPEEVAPAVERLRRVFATEKTYSYEWRVNQLQALLRLCEEGADELRKGLFLDLHKSSIESDLTEIDLVKSECHLALHKLKEWMAPHAVAVNALNMPGQAMIASDPLGVVLIMGAWNYPVQLTLAPLVGAIAGGNCAVIKPGSYAPNSSHVMAALIQKFLDPEAFVVCEGDRHVTDALLKQRFDLIFYTGSGFVGKIVAKAAAEHLTPCVLELGGKSPAIVDKSANLEVAASRLIWGSFLNGGQTCVRPDHCLVHVDVADKFLALCKSKIKEFYGEDAQKTEFYGRIINQGAFERLQALIEKSRPNIAIGGRTDPKDRFVEPTIVYYGADLAAFDAAPAMQDEIFGGILPMAAFSDLDRDVIQRIRRLPTGKPLALYLYAEDANVREQIIARTTSGGMCVNDNLMHLAVHTLHFGGVGQSGMGKYHGHESFKTFTHQKSILLKNGTLDGLPGIKETLAVRFPPYTPAKQAIIKSLANPAFEPVAEFLQSDTAKRLVLALLGAFLFRKLGFRITSAL